MTFKEVIQKYLEQAHTTPKEFAKSMKVKEQDIIDWTKGLNYPMFKQRLWILRNIGFNRQVNDPDGFHFEGVTKKAQFKIDNKDDYYNSSTWDKKKKQRFELDNYTCVLCGYEDKTKTGKGLNCHHLQYNNDFGGNEPMFSLVTLCEKCHSIVHSDKKSCRKNLKEIESPKYKLLVIDMANGSHKLYLFTDSCTDKQILAYIKSLEHKFKIKYKNYTIEKINIEDAWDSSKISYILGHK